jgi:hypothetical protein
MERANRIEKEIEEKIVIDEVANVVTVSIAYCFTSHF